MDINLKTKPISIDTFLLTSKIEKIDLINSLKNTIKEKCKQSDLNFKTNVRGYFSGFQSLTKDLNFDMFIKSIQEEIKIIHKGDFIVNDAWGNILLKEHSVDCHNHLNSDAFCGILYLTEGGPGTYFPEYDLTIKEEIGKFVLFSPNLFHEVKKSDIDKERITLAFNADKPKGWLKYEI
jgi:hypothetical protein